MVWPWKHELPGEDRLCQGVGVVGRSRGSLNHFPGLPCCGGQLSRHPSLQVPCHICIPCTRKLLCKDGPSQSKHWSRGMEKPPREDVNAPGSTGGEDPITPQLPPLGRSWSFAQWHSNISSSEDQTHHGSEPDSSALLPKQLSRSRALELLGELCLH